MNVFTKRIIRGLYALLFTGIDALAISTIVNGAVSVVSFFQYYILIILNLFGIIFFVAWGWPVWWATFFVVFCWGSMIYWSYSLEHAEKVEQKQQVELLSKALDVQRPPESLGVAVPTSFIDDIMKAAKADVDARLKKAKKTAPGLEEESEPVAETDAPDSMYR